MSKNVISIIAPVLESDVSIGEAISRGRATNAFGVVEHTAGTYWLHPLDSLKTAEQQGTVLMLGGHTGHGLGSAPNSFGPLWIEDTDDRDFLNSLNGDVVIRGFKREASGTVMRIIGFAENGDYLPTVVRKVWYQCDVPNCLDKNQYTGTGSCAWAHPLKMKKRP
jgi:hypothetical protein